MRWQQLIDRLQQKFPQFETRESQLAMLQDVVSAYEEDKTFLIEAGTGTGKSLAYLIPAMLWSLEKKEPTLIATHTISLQEQLIQKDIPFLLEALGIEMKVVLAKGMHNYVCLRKLYESARDIPDSLFLWAKTTKEGSKSELPVLPSSELWSEIAVEMESCTHMKCPYYKECFFFQARKELADAHLIVGNHHLLFADLTIKEETGENFIFPAFKRLILDEAHHIEDSATEHFAHRVSKKLLLYSLGKLISDKSTGKLHVLRKKIEEAYPGPDKGSQFAEIFNAIEWILPFDKKQISELVESVFGLIQSQFPEEVRIREHHFQTPIWKDALQPQVQILFDQGIAFLQAVEMLEERILRFDDPFLRTKCEGVLADILGLTARLRTHFNFLHHFIFSPLEEMKIRWIENNECISADLDIAPKLSQMLFSKVPTIVMCSATLSTNREFTFIRKQLGIAENASEKIYESPFAYEKQTLLSVPSDLPDPASRDFVEKASSFILSSIEISKGNAFVLFTSYSMMKECENRLRSSFSTKGFPLMYQKEESRTSLLNKFRTTRRAVLFGTDSFWEGVDVVGDALRLVIIVKLPFKAPNDPLFQAKSEYIQKEGGSPFFHYSLPSAIVKFKQGFGRLIRNKNDRGCVVCLDSRLVKKGYGKQFLKSLPACPYVFETTPIVEEKLKEFYSNK